MEMRKSSKEHDHLFMIERVIKLIKARGLQVALAEMENFLLLHPAVANTCMVPVLGLPRAYIVVAGSVEQGNKSNIFHRAHKFTKRYHFN